ncbi:hypothetical protein [Dactylosporangium salmoneum]|uniref:hypothetical protein n=1 Tax=Dactylosporangium salmoneum TaxID=53361 RepID=UPI0031D82329
MPIAWPPTRATPRWSPRPPQWTGDTAWACAPHTEETLFAVRGAFIAVEDGQGLGQFLRLRRRAR